ncbi:hypothetical protein GCM10022254_72730 [Actinomadura meridiana]|uniref:HAD family hydrolase n=1 Tax=Actinomadura meridiana TaxID=559626 RepID=A0ABP8CPQ6_9ACTN
MSKVRRGPITHVAVDYGLTLTSSADDVDPELGMRPVSSAAQVVIRQLDAAGIILALVSNTLACQDRRPALKAAGVDGLFCDRVYLSHEMALNKASPRFYRRVLDDLGIGPCELVVCGNNIDTDVCVPAALGIRAVLLGPIAVSTQLPPRTAVIRHIGDLPVLLTGEQITHA